MTTDPNTVGAFSLAGIILTYLAMILYRILSKPKPTRTNYGFEPPQHVNCRCTPEPLTPEEVKALWMLPDVLPYEKNKLRAAQMARRKAIQTKKSDIRRKARQARRNRKRSSK